VVDFLRGRSRDTAFLQDAMQQALLDLYLSVEHGKVPHDPDAWLWRSAMNRLIDAKRRRRLIRSASFAELQTHCAPTENGEVAEDAIDHDVLHAKLARHVARLRLTKRERLAWRHLWRVRTCAELAGRCGMTEKEAVRALEGLGRKLAMPDGKIR
jgi:DNA-directed RNA polymerase specialized sigma24 family protein